MWWSYPAVSEVLELLLTVSRSLRLMKGELELELMELTSEGSESGRLASQSEGGGEEEVEKMMARLIVMAWSKACSSH